MPLEIPLILSGNFGELRSNHFHTGLDFKTQGSIGKKIFSIDDGFVSRIKISPWGYGKAIYIDHPNGLTSVYAHCHSFSPKIDSIIKKKQIALKKEHCDFMLKKNLVRIKKSELIALSGNSGSSTAPHLHFEIRETKTEHALNPLLFKCIKDNVKDTRKPVIKGIKVYALSKEGYRIPKKSRYFPIKQMDNRTIINNGNPLIIPASFCTKSGGIGFAIHSNDFLDRAKNSCGIYKNSLFINDSLIFRQEISHIDFSTNRMINIHKDYEMYKKNRMSIHKQFCTDGNLLSIYSKKNIVLNVKPNDKLKSKIEIADVHGNVNNENLHFYIANGNIQNDFFDSTFYFPNDFLYKKNDQFEVKIDKYSIYEPIQLKLSKTVDHLNKYSDILHFGNIDVPLQKYYQIKITPKSNSDSSFLVLLHKNKHNKWYYVGGKYEKGVYKSKIRVFGDFKLSIDTISPKVIALNFKDNYVLSSKTTSLKFNIQDNLSGIKSYHLYVNGKWKLLNWYRKKRYYSFEAWNKLKKGKYSIKLVAIDAVGNISYKNWIVFKQ